MNTITIKTDDLIYRLKVQRVRAAELDAERLAKHEAEEQEWYQKTMARLKELSTKRNFPTYDTLADELFGKVNQYGYRQGGSRYLIGEPPACPTREVVPYDRALAALEIDNRKQRKLSPDGQDRNLYHLLTRTWGEAEAEHVCS